MKTKIFCGITAILFLLIGISGATEHYVSPTGDDATGDGSSGNPWKTIQHAIDQSSGGDVINVAAGTYDEYISINKSVTLNGNNAGIHPAVGMHPTETIGTRGAESIIGSKQIKPSADNIIIDGFSIISNGARIIDTYDDANNFLLKNCIWDNTSSYAQQGVLQFGGGSHTDMTIEFNQFDNGEVALFYLGGGPYDNLTIQYNFISSEGDAVFWTAGELVDGLIKGNEFDGTIDGTPGAGYCTINLGQAGNLEISDNYFHEIAYTPIQVGIINGTINDNTFENIYPLLYSGSWYDGDAIQLWGGEWGTPISNEVTISGNTFHYNDASESGHSARAIRLRPPESDSGIDASSIHILENKFYNGNSVSGTVAIRHQGDQSTTVDADLNYWGTATPDFSTMFEGPVNYCPWYTDEAMTSINYLVHNQTQSTDHCTIQDAINNAVAGDVINVDAGTYYEHVTINKSLTLQGAGASQTTIDVSGMSIQNPHVTVEIANGVNDVLIDGFTLKGIPNTYHADDSVIRCGGSSGTNNNITISNNMIDGYKCILLKNGDNLTIEQNDITFNKNAIVVQYGCTNIDVLGNTISGGSSIDTDPYGIYITGTTGSITGNTIQNIVGPTDDRGKGIGGSSNHDLLIDNNVINNTGYDGISFWGNTHHITISNNTLSNNASAYTKGGAITIKGDDLSITNNDIINSGHDGVIIDKHVLESVRININENNISGNTDYGINVKDASETVDGRFNWWGAADGPSGEGPGSGDAVSTDVNYIPYYTDAAMTTLGPTVTTVYVDDDWSGKSFGDLVNGYTFGYNAFDNVQDGVNAVSASGTVNVATGTYTENVSLNKSLTLQASSSPVIDGGNAGNCINISADNVTVNGLELKNGHNGISGETSNSTISHCTIHNNLNTPGNAGIGIMLWGDCDDNTISDNTIHSNDRQGLFIGYSDGTKVSESNTISGNTIYDNGQGADANPDKSEYGVQLWNADYNFVTGNEIYGHNKWSNDFAQGIYLCSSKYNTVASNQIHDNSLNVAVWDCGGPLAGARSACGNMIVSNTLLDPEVWSVKTFSDARTTYVNFNGFQTSSNNKYVANTVSATLNAQYNWFGGETSLFDADDFSGNVDNSNYFATDLTLQVSPPEIYLPSGVPVTMTVNGMVPTGTYVRGTSMKLSWTGEGSVVDYQSGPTEGSFFTSVTAESYFYDSNPDPITGSDVMVDQSLIGSTSGVGNAIMPYFGTLFSMAYQTVGSGTSDLTLSNVLVTNVNYNNITPVLQSAQIIVDDTPPTVTNVLIDNTTLDTDANSDGEDDYVKDGDDVTITANVSDATSTLTASDIFADLSGFGGGGAVNPSSYASGVATWTLSSVTCTPANGTITVQVLAQDPAGNSDTDSDDITSDNTAPSAVTDFTSTCGHKKVDLSWTNGSDSHGQYKGVIVRYNRWNDYPKYDATEPSYPATETEGTGVSTDPLSGTTHEHTFATDDRDVYYYTAFSVDWAGNFGAPDDPGSSDRSTNYYPADMGSGTGDIPGSSGYDGYVDFDDLMFLSLHYWKTSPLSSPADEANFGPTVSNKSYNSGSGLAVPHPNGDNEVGFEDLMILAVNYDAVSPKNKGDEKGRIEDHFALEINGNVNNTKSKQILTAQVHLANDGQPVKGASVKLTFDPSSLKLLGVETGALFGRNEKTSFYNTRTGKDWVQIDAAKLGSGQTINYSGDLATARFELIDPQNGDIEFSSCTLRDVNNKPIDIQCSSMSIEETLIPTHFDMSQNYPNPFNPETTIEYQLPEPCKVTLTVYNNVGQIVTTLVQEEKEAGSYKAIWNGVDDNGEAVSSGIYYYKIQAGPFSNLRKMVFLK